MLGVAGVLVTAPTLGIDGSANPPHDSVLALGAGLVLGSYSLGEHAGIGSAGAAGLPKRLSGLSL